MRGKFVRILKDIGQDALGNGEFTPPTWHRKNGPDLMGNKALEDMGGHDDMKNLVPFLKRL